VSQPPAVPDDAHLREETLASEPVFDGRLLHVRRDRIRLPDGGQATREFIVHPGAVMVVPILDDGRLVMERQWRYPLARVMLEFPAGKLEAGEPTLQCAQRELFEETGYRAREWAIAGVLHNALWRASVSSTKASFSTCTCARPTISTAAAPPAKSPTRRRWSACSGCRIGGQAAG
jgi:ADP-ribose pyrophosphatase